MAATARMPLWARAAAVPEKRSVVIGAAVASDEREHALVGLDVVGAVPDEVQHVPLVLQEHVVDAFP